MADLNVSVPYYSPLQLFSWNLEQYILSMKLSTIIGNNLSFIYYYDLNYGWLNQKVTYYLDKILCCVVVCLVFFIQRMVPLKQRMVESKVNVSVTSDCSCQFPWKVTYKIGITLRYPFLTHYELFSKFTADL